MKKNTYWIASLSIVVVALIASNSLQAQEPQAAEQPSVVVQTAPVQAEPAQAQPVQVEPAQVVAVAAAECCAPTPKYCIDYRKRRAWRKICCDPCVVPYTAILSVTDPCTCAPIEVPVCVPGCCTDAPSMTCRRGVLGRTITEYSWCCGFRVKIILSSRRGKITVYTYGS